MSDNPYRPAIHLTVALLPTLLLTALAAVPAGAIPEDFYEPVSAVDAMERADPRQGRPCFMVRASWNDALDGPQPVC